MSEEGGERHDFNLGSRYSQGAIRRARSPRNFVSELLTLTEVCLRYDLPQQRVWALAQAGLINPVREKDGRRIMYVADQIKAVLDKEGWQPPPPTNLDKLRREREKGPYQQPFEFAKPLAA